MLLTRLAHDIRHTLRGYRRRPGFAAVAALTLALGIGANATMFGVVDRLLLRPPVHVADPDGVVRFVTTTRTSFAPEPFTTPFGDYAAFAALRDQGRSFAHVAAYMKRELTLGQGRDARLVMGNLASANLFALTGTRPALGRFFLADEDRAGAAVPVVVLGHELWRSRFGGDPTVVGRAVVVQGVRYTVVGVAPAGFDGVDRGRTDLWLPLHVVAPTVMGGGLPPGGGLTWQKIGGSWLISVARLRPGVTTAAASAEATSLVRGSRDPRFGTGDVVRVAAASVIPARAMDPEDVNARLALWLSAMAGLVLLVACANVANLLLARAVERRREIAVRLAMGASRGRLVAQLLAEGLVLAALGGVAALLVAHWGAHAIHALLLGNDDAAATSLVDGRVLAATAVFTLGTGLLAGLVPALQASRPELTSALKLGERSGGSTTHSRTRAALLVAQTTLCVVLLTAAGLFVRSLRNMRSADLGLDADRVLAATVDLSAAPGYTRERAAAFFDGAAESMRGIPGVERVSLASAYPFSYMMAGGTLQLPGRTPESLARLSTGGPYEYDVTPGYFATLGVPLRHGRDFGAGDRAGAPPVLIVNETLARLYWPGEDAVGKCARVAGHGEECAEVVGVVADSHLRGLREEPMLAYYVPIAQWLDSPTVTSRALLVRTRADADPAVVALRVRQRMQSLAADLPFVSVGTLGARLAFELRPARLGAVLFGMFGALALAVAAVGVYGVVSFGVVQRRREFGVRLALGASAGNLVRLVLGEGVRHAALGVALGLIAVLAGGSFVAPFLYEVSPRDQTVLGAVALVLLGVVMVACTAPAWRAARVDPAVALRSE